MKTFLLVLLFGSIVLLFSKKVSSQENSFSNENLSTQESLYIKQIAISDKLPEMYNIQVPALINENFSEIYQNGDHNEALVVQNGSRNYAGAIQKGDENEIELNFFGNFNIALIEQYGYNNFAGKTITGNEFDFHLDQKGDNNLFLMENNLPAGSHISQVGNGMSIIIK